MWRPPLFSIVPFPQKLEILLLAVLAISKAHQCLNLNKLKTIFSSPWLWVFFQTCNVKSLEHQMSRLDCNFCTLRLKLSWLFAFSSYEISKFSEFLLDNLLRSLCLFFAHFPNHTAFFYSRFILRSQRISLKSLIICGPFSRSAQNRLM